MESKNVDAARIYAEDSIRKHRESIQYMTLASRLDAVQARLKTAATMKAMTKDIGRVTSRLKSSMASMNLERIEQVMSEFEKTFGELDVRTSTIEGTMNTVMATSAPDNEIQNLIKQVLVKLYSFRFAPIAFHVVSLLSRLNTVILLLVISFVIFT